MVISFHPNVFSKVAPFLRNHFGDPPRTAYFHPIPRNGLWVLATKNEALAGCIRYRYVCQVAGESIHLVDCFCVHPSWRGQGCATALLSTLRDYATPRGMPRAIFLKEGPPIHAATGCIASGQYWYKTCNHLTHPRVKQCPTSLAHRLVAIRQSLAPDALLLLDKNAPTQEWWIYYTEHGSISALACIQDTHQRGLKGEKMAWFTAWITIDSSTEDTAKNAIADTIDYDAVWFPSLGKGQWTDWKSDGAFHWYVYQWNTSLRIDPKVYVMVM